MSGPSTTRLGELLKVQNGFAFKKEFFTSSEGVPLIRIRDLEGTSTEINYCGPYREEFLVEAGDYVIGMDGEFRCHIWRGPRALLNQRVCRLLDFDGRLKPMYLYYGIQKYLKVIEDHTAFVTVKHISGRQIEDIQIPLPAIEEQCRVVDLLARAEGIVRMRREAEAKAKEIIPVLFADMFGQDSSHVVNSVQDVLARKAGAIRTGPFGSQLLHSEFVGEGIAVLGIDNAVANRFEWRERRFITPHKYRELVRYTVYPGDVLITIMGTCGRCAIVPANIPTAINTKHLCAVSLDRSLCLPEYLHSAFLYDPFVRRQLSAATKGAIMDGLNMSVIRRLRIRVPSLAKQVAYRDAVERLTAISILSESAGVTSITAFQSLLAGVFGGRKNGNVG